MKTCPRCKMTSDCHSECRICHADVSGEPYVQRGAIEKYVLNKYFFIHLFQHHKTTIIGCLGSLGIMISKLPKFGWSEVLVLFVIAVIILADFFPSILPILNDGYFQDTEYSDNKKKSLSYLAKIIVIIQFVWYFTINISVK